MRNAGMASTAALSSQVKQFKAFIGDESIADVDARKAIRRAGSVSAAVNACVARARGHAWHSLL